MSKIAYNRVRTFSPLCLEKFGRWRVIETELSSWWRHKNVLGDWDSVLTGVTAKCEVDHTNQKGSYVSLCSFFLELHLKWWCDLQPWLKLNCCKSRIVEFWSGWKILSNMTLILKKNKALRFQYLKVDNKTRYRNGEGVYSSGLFPKVLVFQPITVTKLEG